MQAAFDEIRPRPALGPLLPLSLHRLGPACVRRVRQGRAFVLGTGVWRFPPGHQDLIGQDTGDQRDGSHRVVVSGDGDREPVRIRVRVRDGHDGDIQPVRLSNRDIFLVRVHHEDQPRKSGHVLDPRQVALELLTLPLQHQALFLRIELESAFFDAALEVLESPYVLLDRLEVREQPTQPALGNVERPRPLSLCPDKPFELRLRAHEQDVAATSDHTIYQIARPIQVPEGLLQVDQVNTAPLREDEPAHLRVPAVRLVAEVDTRL